jgi:hypothetical protein
MKHYNTIDNGLAKLEGRCLPVQAPPRPVFSFIIKSVEDAEVAERCRRENPDALIIRNVIVWPPERDADGNITAPARDYRGPIKVLGGGR